MANLQKQINLFNNFIVKNYNILIYGYILSKKVLVKKKVFLSEQLLNIIISYIIK